MMTVAQIVKHVDGSVPVRFLIAETETGYTLLAALWLAKLFGDWKAHEIGPLFETASAPEQGAQVLDEALRSPHYRAYLKATGRLALQFGYSDSGRYVGQLAASYLIERLRLKIGETLAKHGVSGVEVILFDTHGESIGRGAHPGSLSDRLKYLSPTASRQALNHAGLSVREESAFQGGDGYLLFGTPELASATITRIAEQTYHPAAGPIEDPVYAAPDFSADFSPRCGRGWKRWSRIPAMGHCSAPLVLRCSIAPVQDRRRGRRTAWRRRRAFGIRGNCAPFRTMRFCNNSAGARIRCKAWGRRRRGIRKPSTTCGTTAGAFTARWIWRRMDWRTRTSACCGR